MQQAFEAMDALERGAIANPDENRMVGHYWLRAPDLAPSAEIAAEIRKHRRCKSRRSPPPVHCSGSVQTPCRHGSRTLLSIGIGGSALGPMFVADALGNPRSDRDEGALHRQHRPGRYRPNSANARWAAR